MSLRLKRYYPLPILLVVILVVLTLGFGNQRIVAYTTQPQPTSPPAPPLAGAKGGTSAPAKKAVDYTNRIALFDETVVHTIQLLIANENYQQMMSTYQQTGIKNYFHADIIIDGVRVDDVGVRLKGNASLRTAVGGRGGVGQFPGGNLQNQQNFGRQRGQPGDDQVPQLPEGADPFGGFSTGQSGTTKIPLMIKFDQFAADQTYQGYSRLAIRTYGTSYDAAMLQEPVTNAVVRAIGLPATRTAYTGLRINENAEQLYSISEVIDGTYLKEYFTNPDGVLYKAELGASLRYQGENPSAYARAFTQETCVNDADLSPLIRFMRFFSESDDATFERELPDYFDVDSFAAYLAVNNLLVNLDSIAGMNNNYYLYYDDVDQRFTLLMWDANESMGKLGMGIQTATFDLYYQGSQNMGARMGGGSNVLVSRFMANATFKALYERKLQQVYQQVFASGKISQIVESYAAVVRQANTQRKLVDTSSYSSAVSKVLDFIARRSSYLATTPLLKGLTG